MAPQDLSERLKIGLRPRLRRLWNNADRLLRLHYWFPHVPLFLAAAIFGTLEAWPVLERILAIHPSTLLHDLHDVFDHGLLRRPQAVSGMLLLVMSVGLLLRSRLAWGISLFLVLVSLILSYFGVRQSAYIALGTYNVLLLAGLVVGHRHFRRSSLAAASLFAGLSIVSALLYAIVGVYLLGDQFSPEITDLATASYFAIVTMSTVGYGDYGPATPTAMLFVVSMIVLGITVFATSLSTLIVPLLNQRMERLMAASKGNNMDRSGHYIITGQTALALNSHRELTRRNQKVTFIIRDEPRGELDGLDIVHGDPSSTPVLERAGLGRAVAVLALDSNDSENAFVILAVKDMAPGVKTVTVANDAGNLARLKRVQPDLIIAPQIIGGELLAMALTGEKMNSERLLQQLLHIDDEPL